MKIYKNLSLFKIWICETQVCCETRVLKTWVLWKKYSEKFWKFFMKPEYHEILDFAKLKYPKSGRSLYIFETVVNYNIVCKKMLFDYFHPF